jgi:hypothetical protein
MDRCTVKQVTVNLTKKADRLPYTFLDCPFTDLPIYWFTDLLFPFCSRFSVIYCSRSRSRVFEPANFDLAREKKR